MIYGALQTIQTEIDRLGIFATRDIHLGDEEYELHDERWPACYLKSGTGSVQDSGTHWDNIAHIICIWREQGAGANVESTVSTNLVKIMKLVKSLNHEPVFYTTDEDILEPFGIPVIPMAPPYGGFRLDIEIEDAI